MWVVGLSWLVFKEEESIKWELVYELVAQGGVSQSSGKGDSQQGMRGGFGKVEKGGTFAGGWATLTETIGGSSSCLLCSFYTPLKYAASN